MIIDRKTLIYEEKIREVVRKAIKIVQKRQKIQQLQENRLKKVIKQLLEVNVGEETPHKSTGINVLEDLLKKIIPILEDDYKSLTSNAEQRQSFRAHILNGVKNAIAPIKVMDSAGENDENDELNEANIEIGDDFDDFDDLSDEEDQFIDVPRPGKKKKDDPKAKKDDFTLPDHNKTGRNVALKSFQKIEKVVIDAYDVLSDDEDQQLFYDYLLTNLKLYFEKFEDELRTELPEPDVQVDNATFRDDNYDETDL